MARAFDLLENKKCSDHIIKSFNRIWFSFAIKSTKPRRNTRIIAIYQNYGFITNTTLFVAFVCRPIVLWLLIILVMNLIRFPQMNCKQSGTHDVERISSLSSSLPCPDSVRFSGKEIVQWLDKFFETFYLKCNTIIALPWS